MKCPRCKTPTLLPTMIEEYLPAMSCPECRGSLVKMPSIFTDAWQRRIRQEKTEETRSAILKRTIGEAAAAKVEEFRAWLNTQKEKTTILTYLYRDS